MDLTMSLHYKSTRNSNMNVTAIIKSLVFVLNKKMVPTDIPVLLPLSVTMDVMHLQECVISLEKA